MKKLLLVIIPIVIIVVGILVLGSRNKENPQNPKTQNIENSKEQTSRQIPGYQGNVLTNEGSPYLEFTKIDYEKALAEGKIIVLNFYANWCPVCRVEQPEVIKGFDSLNSSDVVGFRVSFNDSDTDDDEKQLAKQFKIPYQHTKLILKNGQEVKRSGDQWDKETFLKEVNSIL